MGIKLRMAALILSSLGGVASASSLDPATVPLFTIKARIISPAAVQHTFHLGNAAQTVANNVWTAPMSFDLAAAKKTLKDYPAIYMDQWPVVTGLSIDGIAATTHVEAELTFAEGGPPVLLSGDLFGPSLGIMIWRDDEKHARAATKAMYNREKYWSALKPPADLTGFSPSRKLVICDRFIGGDDDSINWAEGIAHLSAAGFNSIQIPPDRRIHEMLRKVPGVRAAWAVYAPPGYVFPDAAPTEKPPQALDAWAAGQARAYADAGFDLREIAMFAMSDEPGWYYPQAFTHLENPQTLARFQAYLQAQHLTPPDVGATEWGKVRPLGRTAANKDLASRRLFYWSARFMSYDATRYFADATRAMEKAFYPGLPLSTNFNFFAGRFWVPGPVANNSDKKNPDAAMGGFDWLEFGRLRGSTLLWTEDWFPDSQAWQWSLYASRLRCAAEKSNDPSVSFGGYVVPRASGDRPDGILQKMLCLVGSGAKVVNTYIFGPEYNFPGNCYSENTKLLPRIAQANRLLAAADDLLYAGRRPHPQIAILSPRSAELWDARAIPIPHQIDDATNTNLNGSTVDYMAEVADLYLALQHANLPADFVEEEDLSPAGLSRYRVLYITEPNIPAEFQTSLVEWVRAGGTLVTVPGAGARDRYDDPCDTLSTPQALKAFNFEHVFVADLNSLKTTGTLKDASGGSAVFGNHEGFHYEDQSELAFFDDHSAAITRHAVGKGTIMHFAFFPGLSYMKSATQKRGSLPTGFAKSLRDWIVLAASSAGVEQPVVGAPPLVETPVLVSDLGYAVTLLNWSGRPIEKLDLKIRVPFAVKQVAMSSGAAVTFKEQDGALHISTSLGSADVLLIRP